MSSGLFNGDIVPVTLGPIKVLAIVDGAELEETKPRLGAVAAEAGC